jgi:hypothetical protein
MLQNKLSFRRMLWATLVCLSLIALPQAWAQEEGHSKDSKTKKTTKTEGKTEKSDAGKSHSTKSSSSTSSSKSSASSGHSSKGSYSAGTHGKSDAPRKSSGTTGKSSIKYGNDIATGDKVAGAEKDAAVNAEPVTLTGSLTVDKDDNGEVRGATFTVKTVAGDQAFSVLLDENGKGLAQRLAGKNAEVKAVPANPERRNELRILEFKEFTEDLKPIEPPKFGAKAAGDATKGEAKAEEKPADN